MNKKFKFASAVLSACLLITPVSGLVNNYSNVAKANFEVDTYENEMYITVKKINKNEINQFKNSNYYEMSTKIKNLLEKDKKSNKLKFKMDYKELAKELKISEDEALKLIKITETAKPLSKIENRGFVGLHLNIGPYVRGLTPVVAGAFVGGYVGFYLKELAASGPWGAAAAVSIDAAISFSVGYAVSKGLSYKSVGIDVPFVSWSKTITLP